ncbi:hypothetical protein G9E11_04290 [Arthrobacter sp. IA7]|nr:hypothetical protein [Arthrobacter ipis]
MRKWGSEHPVLVIAVALALCWGTGFAISLVIGGRLDDALFNATMGSITTALIWYFTVKRLKQTSDRLTKQGQHLVYLRYPEARPESLSGIWNMGGATRAEDTVGSLLEQALDVFGVRGAALFSGPAFDPASGAGPGARLLARAGELTEQEREGTDFAGHTVEPVDDGTWLVLFGRTVPAADSSLLGAFAAHVLAQLERQQLAASRLEVLRLAEGNTMRTAILRAVSHDLRTPLAGIKLAVGGLLQTAVTYPPEEKQELLETIDECSDRLDALVGNLLDMSRITADSVRPLLKPVRWLDVVPPALRGLPAGSVRVELPPNLPAVDADAVLLERVIANIAENAVKYAPASDVKVTAAAGGLSRTILNGHPAGELRIIDHGRGVPGRNVPAMFRPFQRLDDVSQSTGVGLGLAVARGFVSAMGGSLAAEETPGGGLTMVIRLPLSTGHDPTGAGGGAPAAVPGVSVPGVSPAVSPQETAQ